MTVETRPLHDGDLSVTVGGVDVTAVARKVHLTTTIPGGFGQASFDLPTSAPFDAYHASVVRDAAVVISHDTQVLFEGRVTNDISAAVIEGGKGRYSVAAAGKWYDASLREDGLLVLCDTDYDQWTESTRGRPEQYATDSDGRLALVASRGLLLTQPAGGTNLDYWLHRGLGDPDENVDHLLFVLGDYGDGNSRGLDLGLAGNMRVAVRVGDSPYDPDMAADTTYSPSAQVAAGTAYRCPATAGESLDTPARCVSFRLYCTSDTTPTADRYIVIREIYLMMDDDYFTVSAIAGDFPATVTTTAAHGLKVGDRVFIYSCDVSTYDGPWTVLTVPTTTTCTIDAKGATDATSGYLERIPSPVDAMAQIGESIGGGSATIDDTSYAAALPGSVAVRPHRTAAQAMDDLGRQFSVQQAWGWWEDGDYEQESVETPTSGYYEVDATAPGVTWNPEENAEGQPDYVRVLHKLGPVIGLGAMRLTVTYTPNGGGAAVTVDCPISDDGRLRSADDTYATAYAGGAAVDQEDATDDYMYAGQYKASKTPLYRLHEAFVDFDVTGVPDDCDSVDTVVLSAMCRTKNVSGDSFTLRAYSYDWGGGTPAAADWRTPAQLTTIGHCAGTGTASINEGKRFNFTDVSMATVVSNALVGNAVRLVLASNEYAAASAPTGAEYVALWSEDADVGAHPLEGQVVQTVVGASGMEDDDPGFVMDAKRVRLLDMSDVLLTTADAQSVGRQYLDWLVAYRATVRLTLPAVDINGGGSVPPAYIRAGEWIKETAGSVGPVFIARTDYSVADCAMTLTLGKEQGEFRAQVDGRYL